MSKSKLPAFLSKAEMIGHVGVDSGTIHIGDPCYLTGWVERTLQDGKQPWFEYLTEINQRDRTEDPSIVQPIGDRMGLHMSTTYGDGIYPVYASINSEGRPKWVLIDFYGEDED